MEEDAKYIPRSAKATDFKITLSAGAKEDEERVSFLEQQIQQANDSYESSLKSVIEECIALEIQAAKKRRITANHGPIPSHREGHSTTTRYRL